jgi:hypothetical protein
MTFESEAQRSRFAHGWLVRSSSFCQLSRRLQLALHAVLQRAPINNNRQSATISCNNSAA